MEESGWFRKYAPEFEMMGDRIRVLYSPNEFYLTLKTLLPSARRRIVISSLYIGTGHLENQLIDSVKEAMMQAGNNLKVQILLDYTRGSRGNVNSRSLLLPLLNLNRDVNVAFYHTPHLRGIQKRVLPHRYNEVIGLQHMKIYVVDDSVIMSGANLSHDYFTNRQDRYIVLEDKSLADFFQSLVATVSTFSMQLNPDNSESLHADWNIHPFKGDYSAYNIEVRRRIEDLISFWSHRDDLESSTTKNLLLKLGIQQQQAKAKDSKADSKVYPLLQLGPYNLTYDEDATQTLFQLASERAKIFLATGYFNLTPQYSHVITQKSKAQFQILTASPEANGFFGGSGISGFIPKLYLYLAKLFVNKLERAGQQERVVLSEYQRENWTFHGKGLWYYPPESLLPTLTLIGSPNFGCRSVHRDLEAQVAIVTSNVNLMKQLHSEQQKLYEGSCSSPTKMFARPDRHIPLWVRLFSRVFKSFF